MKTPDELKELRRVAERKSEADHYIERYCGNRMEDDRERQNAFSKTFGEDTVLALLDDLAAAAGWQLRIATLASIPELIEEGGVDDIQRVHTAIGRQRQEIEKLNLAVDLGATHMRTLNAKLAAQAWVIAAAEEMRQNLFRGECVVCPCSLCAAIRTFDAALKAAKTPAEGGAE